MSGNPEPASQLIITGVFYQHDTPDTGNSDLMRGVELYVTRNITNMDKTEYSITRTLHNGSISDEFYPFQEINNEPLSYNKGDYIYITSHHGSQMTFKDFFW